MGSIPFTQRGIGCWADSGIHAAFRGINIVTLVAGLTYPALAIVR
jgi:hypothetical protein